jgi:predicted nucleic acid-binding protein
MMRTRLGERDAHEFLRRIRSSAHVRKVFVPESWEDAAEDLLVRYADQPFSYVDATSFVTMRRLQLQEALAFDHHFLVAGFALIGD